MCRRLASSARTGAAPDIAHAVVFPVVFVGPFQANRRGGPSQMVADMLRAKAARRAGALRRNLGHERSAAGACAVAPRCGDLESRYGLTANVEISDPRALSVNVRLTDLADGRIAFVRTYQQLRRDGDNAAAVDAIVREVSSALA